MGMFFDGEKSSTPAKEQKYGIIGTIFLIVLVWILTILGWVFKPLFLWLFDFKDNSKELAWGNFVPLQLQRQCHFAHRQW